MFRFGNLLVILIAAHSLAAHASGRQMIEFDFNNLPSGPFEELQDSRGKWSALKGHAEINSSHRRSPPHALRIFGGENRSVRLEFTSPMEDVRVSFWAERWTARDPFHFRIESHDGVGWSEVYVGDSSIIVGGFHEHVDFDIDGISKALRFTSTSPEGSGVLIDDMRIREPGPMEIVDAENMQLVLPVLIRNEYNPTVTVLLRADGQLDPKEITRMAVSLENTDNLKDIESVTAFYSGAQNPLRYSNSTFEENILSELVPFGDPQTPARNMTFSGEQSLSDGDNYFVISIKLSRDASLLNHIDASVLALEIDGGQTLRVEPEPREVRQRIGYAVRKCGDDSAVAYRIPGLATSNDGTMIGIYDIRWRNWGDLPGRIDVGMSRSTDGGQSWAPMKIIMDMGDHDRFHGNGIGDPAVLVDQNTGTIWVAATWSHGNRSWHGSGPGLEPEETGQLMLSRSDDDGLTWSDPINITKQIKDPAWRFVLQGPGTGITMKDGTIVFAAQYRDADGMPYSTILYSSDHGETWEIGTGAKSNTTEAQGVELDPGVLMLNMRDNRGGSRSVYVTEDMGETWQTHSTSRDALIEPVCMASLIKDSETGKLFFSNPNTRAGRHSMTIKVSDDMGKTWPVSMFTLIDEGYSAGYSCLTMVEPGVVGILYEGSRAPMTFQKFRIEELTE